MATAAEVKAAINVMKAIADMIKEVGTTNEGALYSPLCGIMSADRLRQILGILERAGLITRSGFQITWNN